MVDLDRREQESDHDRIIRLEEKYKLGQKALELARELVLQEHLLFKETTEKHFERANGMQQRLDKQAELFSLKKDCDEVKAQVIKSTAGFVEFVKRDELDEMKRLVYGAVAVLGLIVTFIVYHILGTGK